MVGALAPLCSRVGRTQPAGPASGSGGRVADWLRIFNTTDAKPLDLCRAAVEAAPEGDRYPTTFSAIVALVRVGFTDAEIVQHVVEPYLARFDRRSQPDSPTAIMSGLRWARAHIGPDADAIAARIMRSQICLRAGGPAGGAARELGNFDLVVGFDTEYVRGLASRRQCPRRR